MRDGHEDVHGAGDGESNAFSALQSQRFRNKFAQDNQRISDGQESQGSGKSVSVETGVKNVAEPGNDDRGKSSLTYPSQAEAGQSNAKLYGGKEFIKPLLDLADGTRADAAL